MSLSDEKDAAWRAVKDALKRVVRLPVGNPDTNRLRWAVLAPSGIWYFPTKKGKLGAKKLAERLNKEAA